MLDRLRDWWVLRRYGVIVRPWEPCENPECQFCLDTLAAVDEAQLALERFRRGLPVEVDPDNASTTGAIPVEGGENE